MSKKEQTDSDSSDSNKNDKDATKTYYWKLVFGGVVAFLALIFVSVNIPYLKDRAKFFTENALSLSILIAVIVQAIISNRQWKAMQAQAKSADESVVFGLRAYVGIHSLDPIDAETKRICLRIENSGKVPAYDIDVDILMEVKIPEQSIPDEQSRNPPWKIRGGFAHQTWGYSHFYGRAKLFPRGNLQIAIPVALNSWLTRKQIALIAEGPAEMRFKGNIEFNDGFHKGKNSSFAFRYSPESHQWIIDSVITKGEVEARLRERAGGRDLSQDWHIIETYAPRIMISKEDKPDQEGNKK